MILNRFPWKTTCTCAQDDIRNRYCTQKCVCRFELPNNGNRVFPPTHACAGFRGRVKYESHALILSNSAENISE